MAGAEALDRLTRGDPIDLFVLFSSVTTLLGNPGQASYVAANAALEAIAERRHAAGLPALAVGWGPIGDAGYPDAQARVSRDAGGHARGGPFACRRGAWTRCPRCWRRGPVSVLLTSFTGATCGGRLPDWRLRSGPRCLRAFQDGVDPDECLCGLRPGRD